MSDRHHVAPPPPTLWHLTIARRWPGHWCFDREGNKDLALLLAPAAVGVADCVLIRLGYWVYYSPRPHMTFGRELCDAPENLPMTIAKLLCRVARSRAHGYNREILLNGHAPSGGHPAWLQSAIDHAWTSSGTPEGAAP